MAERDRKLDYDAAYQQSWAAFGSWQTFAREDIRATLGDVFNSREKESMRKQKRDMLNIHLIRRIIKWISGYQRDHRLGLEYEPSEGSDEETAGQLSQIVNWALGHFGGYNIISDGFEHCLKTGMGLINTFNDQNLDTKLDLFFYNQFLLDPNFTRIDLTDCNYGMIRKYISRNQAKILLPREKHPLIPAEDDKARTNEKFPNYKLPTLFGENLLAYDEFQQRDTIDKFIVFIRQVNQEFEFTGSRSDLDNTIRELVARTGIPPNLISTFERTDMTVRVTSFINDKEVSSEIDPFGIEDFSFTPIIAFYDPEHDEMWLKLQGIARCLVDPQKVDSKRLMSMVAHFEMQIGAGLDYEQDALLDDEDAFTTGPGKPRVFKKGALADGRARDRVTPPLPKGEIQIHQVLENLALKMVNLNPDMLGDLKAVGGREQISGVLSKLRIGAGLIGLRGLFDNLSLSQQVIGQKILKLIQKYPIAKVRRILNEEPTQAFHNKRFGRFDAVVAEAALTDTQRNQTYAELLNIKRMGADMQDPAPITWPMLLKLAPIKMKREIMAEIAKLEQQKQQAQQQAQKSQQMREAVELELAKGNVMANRGIAEERRTQAVENQADAALTRAKTAAEITDMSVGRFLELVDKVIGLETIGQQNVKAEAKS
jgi:hypothetical protein